MSLSATLGYGIAISHASAVAAGFISLDTLADAVADELPFMHRISNGDVKQVEDVLIMVIQDTIAISHDFSHSLFALPEVNTSEDKMLNAFVDKNLPLHDVGWTLSAFTS